MDKPCKISQHIGHDGYGRIKRIDRFGHVHQLEHRWVYAIANDYEFEEGEVVRHLCNNPACIEYTHLALGSYQDNTNDAIKAGTHIKGEKVASSKLTKEDVILMREMHAERISFKEIAEEFDVHRDTAYDAIVGRTWKHVK